MKTAKNLTKSAQPFVLGLAIGTIAALLSAPQKGMRTRNKLSKKAEDMKDTFKIKLLHAMDAFKGKVNMSTDKINSFMAIEKSLNSRIATLTNLILRDCPELFNNIDEMTEGTYVEADPEISIKNLKSYVETLETMYKKYMKHNLLQTA